jgi:hypothetical protein
MEKNEKPIILDSEKLFLLSINNHLNNNGANWIIHNSEYKFCYVDFVLINLNNLYTIHLEYKERNYAYGYKSYDTYFISLRKYQAIKKCYNNCYIVWDFTHNTKNDNEFYYIKFDDKLFDTFESDEDKSRLLIPANLCKTGFVNLMTELVDKIPNRNLI